MPWPCNVACKVVWSEHGRGKAWVRNGVYKLALIFIHGAQETSPLGQFNFKCIDLDIWPVIFNPWAAGIIGLATSVNTRI